MRTTVVLLFKQYSFITNWTVFLHKSPTRIVLPFKNVCSCCLSLCSSAALLQNALALHLPPTLFWKHCEQHTRCQAASRSKANEQSANVAAAAAATFHVPGQSLKTGVWNHPSGVDGRLPHYGLKRLGQTNGTEAEVQRVVESPEEDEVRVVEDDHLLLFPLTQPAKQWNTNTFCTAEKSQRGSLGTQRGFHSYFMGTASHSLLTALSFSPSRTKMWVCVSSTWNPVTKSSSLLRSYLKFRM